MDYKWVTDQSRTGAQMFFFIYYYLFFAPDPVFVDLIHHITAARHTEATLTFN